MKLIWKNKIFWKEMLYSPLFGIYVERRYINPLIAIPTIIMALPTSYFFWKWILG